MLERDRKKNSCFEHVKRLLHQCYSERENSEISAVFLCFNFNLLNVYCGLSTKTGLSDRFVGSAEKIDLENFGLIQNCKQLAFASARSVK